MPILEERHDFAHPVEADTAWSESYYFNSYDPVSETGFFTRIGIRPLEGTIDAGLSVWVPGGGLATAGGVRPQHEMIDDGLTVAGVTYERIAPMQAWRVTADADAVLRPLAPSGGTTAAGATTRTVRLRVDARFDALMPAIGTDGQGREGRGASAATRQSVGKGHLEQAGRWTGTIEIDGVAHVLADARGNRDKSWGPRRWGGPRMWRWFSINIGDSAHFGGIRIGTDAGDLHRGWVWRDGEHTSIREWQVKTELEPDGITHRVSHVTAVDKRDRVHALRGDLLYVAPSNHETGDRRTVLLEGLARWEYDGEAGYGISEYLHQLDGTGRPLVAIE